MKKRINFRWFSLLFLGAVALSSCEDVIDVDLDERPNQLVVDAFLTNDSGIQTVRLTMSAPYFLNEPARGESGASVKVFGPNGKEFNFADQGNGNYNYNPKTGASGPMDSIGFNYSLQLIHDGKVYTAISTLNPVPTIDSMSFEFEEAELGSEEGYYAQFWAQDFFGRKDYYWIRSYKNGLDTRYVLDDPSLNNPAALILSEDAAFGGEGADGFVFILPLRAAITNDDDPFQSGDLCEVELLSLNGDVYEFLDQVTIQANNQGLFSTPPANIRSNIKDVNGSLQEEVLGVFSLSSISKNSIQIIP